MRGGILGTRANRSGGGDEEVAQVTEKEEINVEIQVSESPASLVINHQEVGEPITPSSINNPQRASF